MHNLWNIDALPELMMKSLQTFVWSYFNDDDLCSDDNDYYSGAVPIIELQIAKQSIGWRRG